MSAARSGVIKWTTAGIARTLALPFVLLGAMTACSDGGSSPSFVDDGTVSRHGSLRITPAQMTVREGDSVQVNASLVGGSGAFDATKVQWNIQPSRAGTVRGGYFVADYYGDVTLTASFSGATGSSSAKVLPAPRDVRELSSSFFAGTAGRALPDSVAVLVTGRDGVPVPEVEVAFSVVAGGGGISPATAMTDAQGIARAAWTLGASTGRNVLQAGIATVGTATLEAEAYADLSTAIVEVLDGEEQEGVVGEPLPRPIQVRVSDANGNPIRGVTMEWLVPGDASETGYFQGVPPVQSTKRTVTDPGGVAQVYWRLGTLAGDQTGSATLIAAGSSGSGASGAPGGNGKGNGGNGKTDFGAKAKPGHLDRIQVSPDPISTEVDATVTLAASATDKWGNTVDADYTWSVADATIASVDGTGVVTTLKPGKTTVMAKAGSASDEAQITVLSGAPASTQATGSGQTGTVGSALDQALTLKVMDANGVVVPDVTVAWSVVSGGGSVAAASATTDGNGVSTAQWTLGNHTGQQEVRATVSGTTLDAVSFTATAEAPSVATVTVSPATANVAVGGSVTLSAVAKNASGQTLSATFDWTSSDASIATVRNGLVTGVAGGLVEIKATANGVSGSAVVTVGGGDTGSGGTSVALVEANIAEYTFTALGTSTQLSAVALDGSGDPLIGTILAWSSSDTSIASVDTSGKVIAKAVGLANIIVCAAACSVADTVAVVVEQLPAAVEVTPASVSMNVGESYPLTAVVKDAGGYSVPGAVVTWASSNPTVATVSTSGVVTALTAGDVSFTASSGAFSDASQVAVMGEGGGAGGGDGGTGSTGTPVWYDDFDGGGAAAPGYQWGGLSNNVTISSTNAFSGSQSMKFSYPGKADLCLDGTAERRFTFGEDLEEVWIEYYFFLPENFYHRSPNCASKNDPNGVVSNNKFFALWDVDYRAQDVKTVLEYRKTGDGDSYMYLLRGTDTQVSYSQGLTPWSPAFTDALRGRWAQIRIHVKVATNSTSNDGIWEMWVNGQKVMGYYNLDLAPETGGNRFFRNGYLMGWANSGFNDLTEFFVDDFTVFGTNPGW